MSLFDAADRDASAALDTVLADAVVWKPMVPRPYSGDGITIDKTRNPAPFTPDPNRVARPLSGETGFVAVVTWKSAFIEASDKDMTKREVLAANDVMLDFDRRLFKTNGVEKLPQSNDIFEVAAEDGHTIRVQQSREPYDDGGARIVVFCITPAW